MKKPATVYVIDDDPTLCHSLKWLIETVNIEVKTYIDAKAFLQEITPSAHGCIVTDVRMPVTSGFELHEELQIRNIKLPVIFVTGYGDIQMAVRAMKNGAIDFITKPYNDQELLDALSKALKIDAERIDKEHYLQRCQKRLASISSREYEIAELIVTGYSNKQVAQKLAISPKTVEVHRANIMSKTAVKSFAELVILFHQSGNQST